MSLVGLGAVDRLCQLIAHSNVLVRRKAIITLGTMATSSELGSTKLTNISNLCISVYR